MNFSTDNIFDISTKPNYTVLAEIYDEVMHDVDYEAWTDYIDEIIMQHHHKAEDLLELACGTGTMALSIEEFGYYNILATDASQQMIEIARKKAEKEYSDVEFKTMNFLDFDIDRKFDIVYMVFDSLNYLHNDDDILKLHQNVREVLNPGGLFIYDFTTPRNSINAISYLDKKEQKVGNTIRYRRDSKYDHKDRLHTNTFKIEKLSPQTGELVQSFTEVHRQRIYTLEEITDLVNQTDFDIIAAYDGFKLIPARKNSLRITMVLK